MSIENHAYQVKFRVTKDVTFMVNALDSIQAHRDAVIELFKSPDATHATHYQVESTDPEWEDGGPEYYEFDAAEYCSKCGDHQEFCYCEED